MQGPLHNFVSGVDQTKTLTLHISCIKNGEHGMSTIPIGRNTQAREVKSTGTTRTMSAP